MNDDKASKKYAGDDSSLSFAMHLRQISIDDLVPAIDHIGREAFDRLLLNWLSQLVFFDSALAVVYPRDKRPQILVDDFKNPDRRNDAKSYVDSAYLLDPFYLHARRATEPTLVRLRDIVPESFATSQYVEIYYRRSAIKDEVNFLIPIDRATYAICIERSIRWEAFSEDDLARLQAVRALVTALVQRHGALAAARLSLDEPDQEHHRLKRVLANFAGDVLTQREREVVGLMLGGYAPAQISEQLKISTETARVHRRNIYNKLGISSLAELFSRALAELAANRFIDR